MGGEWRTVKLEDVSKEITVGYVGSMTSEYVESGIPFLRSKNIEPFKINTNDIKYISPAFHKKVRKSCLTPGDVVIVRTGKPGICAVIPSWLEDANCSDLVIVRCGPEINNRYLAYYVNTISASHVNAHLVGAVQQHFNVGSAKLIEVKLPSIPEQESIVDVLGSLDDKIELNRQINATLESMAQALFKSWFVDFDPVIDNALKAGSAIPPALQARAERRKALHAQTQNNAPVQNQHNAAHPKDPAHQYPSLPEEIQQLFPSSFVFNEELGWVPDGWEALPLDEIAHYQNGLALQKFRPENEEDFLPVLKISQLRKGFADGEEKASSKIKPECIVDNGDVLFSWSGSLMVDVWCGGRAALNQHLFKVTSETYPKWLYLHFTKHHLEEFQRIAADKAVTMGHIKREHLKEAFCAVPKHAVVDQLAVYISHLVEKAVDRRLESVTLRKIRDGLLPRLLSGQIKIPEVEKQLAEVV